MSGARKSIRYFMALGNALMMEFTQTQVLYFHWVGPFLRWQDNHRWHGEAAARSRRIMRQIMRRRVAEKRSGA